MRITTVLLVALTSAFQLLSAKPAQAQALEKRITVSYPKTDLYSAIKMIQKDSGIDFAFAGNLNLDGIIIPAGKFTDEPLEVILTRTLGANGIAFKETSGMVTLYRQPGKGMIKGVVTNADGTPLAGASVRVVGTEESAATDTQGLFEIRILPGHYVLEVAYLSYLTYRSSEITVSSDHESLYNIVLSEDQDVLDEVVVVGYGTQLKRVVTSSIASLPGSELKEYSTANFTETMAGRIPGVQISQVTGEPGEPLNIRIRGAGSITAGNNPLYVVDGFPLGEENLNAFNQQDIESIEVLKDASASAIYGSRGANGVVLITTHKGNAGPAKVDFSASHGIQQLSKKIDVLSPEEYVDFAIDAVQRAWVERGGNADDPNEVRSPLYRIAPYFLSPDEWTYTDWQDEIYTTAPVSTLDLRVSGGQEKLAYMFSGGYLNQRGILRNTGYQRFSFRSNISGKLSDRVSLSVNLAPSYGVNDRILSNGRWSTGAVGSALALPGFFPTRNADGTYPSFAGFGYNTSNGGNPMALVNETDGTDRVFRMMGGVQGSVSIMDGLTYRLNTGVDYLNNENQLYKGKLLPDISDLRPGGSYASGSSISGLVENTLSYGRDFADHRLDALLGQSAQLGSIQSDYIEGNNYPNDLVKTLNAAQITAAGNLEEAWTLSSYFFRLNYAFKNRYFLSGAIRRDGSSRFGQNSKWGTFPSVSMGWLLSDEPFLRDVRAVNSLKIRASYGLAGNNFIPNYGSIGLLTNSNYVYGAGAGTIANAIYAGSLGNPNLSWETSKQFDAGLDAAFFNNRLTLVADYYHKLNTDLLLDVSVPAVMGVQSSLQNIGKVRNQGIELQLSSVNTTGEFVWKTDLNIAANRNKVLELGPNGDPIFATSGTGGTNVTHITQIGKPIGSFYGFIFDGVYNTVEEINNHPHLSTDIPGDPIIRDVSGDGEITMDDRTIIGDAYPDYTFGFKNDFSYKGFDLSVFIYGAQGGEIMNQSKYFTASMTGRLNSLGEARDRWRSPEEPGNGKVFSANIDINGYRRLPSTFYIEDASFVRLRTVTLGYDVSRILGKRCKLDKARVYVSGQNLFTWSPYKMYNPEASMTEFNSQLTPGSDQDVFPLAKTFTMGISVSF